jgi:hypothetical protein
MTIYFSTVFAIVVHSLWEAWVPSQVSSCVIYGGQSGTGEDMTLTGVDGRMTLHIHTSFNSHRCHIVSANDSAVK